MKKRVLALICLSLFGLLTACNTMQGLGEDIRKGGEDLSSAASRNK